ncbi:MAG TPA: ribosome maturation factor RimM [Polyangiaceae bacterium]
MDATRWVALAEVARPHGIRGEVKLRVYSQDSDVLLEMDEVLVRLATGEEHEVSIDVARRADKSILLKLHSVDDRNRAEELRGAKICVRRSDFPVLEEGEFYACDVEGSEVVLGVEVLGTVREFVIYPTVDAFIVDGPRGEFEVPVTDAFIERIAVGKVHLTTIEGIELGKSPAKPEPREG